MRKGLVFGILLVLATWALSLVCMRAAGQAISESGESGRESVKEESESRGEEEKTAEETTVEAAAAPASARKIRIERDGVKTFMELEDYLAGVMVCQIDADCHMEALKCQAVIARTYIYRIMDGRSETSEEELDLDYLGAESGASRGVSGMTLDEKERLALRLERCLEAARETSGVVMKYEGRLILPMFHAVSAGRTRKGEADYPYLAPVESKWDTQREDYMQEFSWSRAEFARLISGIPDAAPVSPDQVPDEIQTVKKDDSGYVLQIKIGAKTYSGEEVQYALSLPSACFFIEGEGDEIRAVSRGIGHGYGLSQAGADAMAAEGWGYQDILQYYYKEICFITE